MDQTDLPYQFVIKGMVGLQYLYSKRCIHTLTLDQKEGKTALPSFVQRALESESLTDDERYALKFCSAAMYGGGLDTVGVLRWFKISFLFMPGHSFHLY